MAYTETPDSDRVNRPNRAGFPGLPAPSRSRLGLRQRRSGHRADAPVVADGGLSLEVRGSYGGVSGGPGLALSVGCSSAGEQEVATRASGGSPSIPARLGGVRSRPPSAFPQERNEALAKLLLVGCVKRKRSGPSPAKDLYDSRLWHSRRAYAERSGVPWYILSAKHGLLAPETTIAWYDLALKGLLSAERREWSRRVLDDLAAEVGSLRGLSVEIHAGKDYVENGLEDGLRKAGAIVQRPLAHVPGIQSQRAWYDEQLRNA